MGMFVTVLALSLDAVAMPLCAIAPICGILGEVIERDSIFKASPLTVCRAYKEVIDDEALTKTLATCRR